MMKLGVVRISASLSFEPSFSRYEKLYTLAHVCPFMKLWYKPREEINKSITEMLKNVSLSIEDLFERCYWRHTETPCWKILSPVITDCGICYTFNQLPNDHLLRKENFNSESILTDPIKRAVNWNLESGYAKKAGIHSYPFRPFAKGYRTGLAIVLKTRKNDKEFLCDGPNDGFQVSLHPPDEYKTTSNRIFRLPFQQALLLTVRPQLTTISRELKKHDHSRWIVCRFRKFPLFKNFFSGDSVTSTMNVTYVSSKFTIPTTVTLSVLPTLRIRIAIVTPFQDLEAQIQRFVKDLERIVQILYNTN